MLLITEVLAIYTLPDTGNFAGDILEYQNL